ncbi:MAG: 4Fe-4S binding protein [Anaerolineaceae bacterium]|nr:4Fe-4S binding protein [Anaerolineaceae bacterium]
MKDVKILPIIDLRKCTLCGMCISACEHSVLALGNHQPEIVHPEDCTYCAECEAQCPEGAIACPIEIVWAEKAS